VPDLAADPDLEGVEAVGVAQPRSRSPSASGVMSRFIDEA
jgi:hypothetical protein